MQKINFLLKQINKFLKSNVFEFVILIFILYGFVFVRFYKIAQPIGDWHSWRQVDTASVTQIYSNEGLNFLYPKYYDISSIQTGSFNPNGYRFVEFPIFNFFHLLLFNFFNTSIEVSGRIVSILCGLFTTIFLYLLSKKIINKWAGIVSAFLYAFIPYNVYYTRVILPEPMAVMFSILGILLFYYFYLNDKKVFLFSSALSFAFAVLVKPFAIFYGLPLFVLAFKKYKFKMFVNIPILVSLNIAVLPFGLWRIWMNQKYLLLGIAHFWWAFNGDGIRFRPSFWKWIFFERIGKILLGGWGLIPFGLGLSIKNKGSLVVTSMVLGMFFYLSIIATANVRHDYYQTFIVPAVVISMSQGIIFLTTSKSVNKIAGMFISIFSIFMMFLIGIYEVLPFYSVNNIEQIDIAKKIDEILPKDAKVVFPNNGSTVLLYYTGRYGWPVVDNSFENLISKGANYYVSLNRDSDENYLINNNYEILIENDQYRVFNLNNKNNL